ncbi:GNAT family N-acetyltransferase [Aquimarina addita]
MEYIVRDAAIEDVPKILELIKELAVYEKEPNAVTITVDDLEKEGFGKDPLFQCFVAVTNDQIMGMALVYYRFSTWKGRTIHLEDLIVKEAMRGTGAGTALYKRVMEYAKQKNVKRVEWNVLDWNTPAVDFYIKSGAKILKGWQVVQMDEEGLCAFVSGN